MPQQALCSAIEFAINHALTLNIHGVKTLTALEQKTFTIQLSEIGFPLSFSVNNNKILVTSLTERSDCTVYTSIKTLLDLKKQQQITELIKQEKLDVIGDLKVAQQFASIAESLEIDWQSEIAKHIGDIPTYKLSQFGSSFVKKSNFAIQQIQQIQADASEWLVHEKRLVVTSSQINHFSQQVNELMLQTNDVTERIEKLSNNLAIKTTTT